MCICRQFRRISSVLADKTVNFAGLRETPRRGDSHFSHLCGCAKVHTYDSSSRRRPCVRHARVSPHSVFNESLFPLHSVARPALRIFCEYFQLRLLLHSPASFEAGSRPTPLTQFTLFHFTPLAQSADPFVMSGSAARASWGLSCYCVKPTLLRTTPPPRGSATRPLPESETTPFGVVNLSGGFIASNASSRSPDCNPVAGSSAASASAYHLVNVERLKLEDSSSLRRALVSIPARLQRFVNLSRHARFSCQAQRIYAVMILTKRKTKPQTQRRSRPQRQILPSGIAWPRGVKKFLRLVFIEVR
jgi:hypothetical protein